MPSFDFDLFTIGAGSGGVRASRVAASYGARVAVAEERHLGGTCVNIGCIPKKLFSYAAHVHEELDDAQGFGWQIPPAQFHWPTLLANKDREIARLNGIYARLLENAGVQVLHQRATVIDAHTVACGDRHYRAKHILIATGARPVMPAIPGIEFAISSDDAFALPALPQRALVVGGGYIAVEFASIFQGLGVPTTLVYRGKQLLRQFDTELGVLLAEEMRKKGVQILLETDITALEKTTHHGLRAHLSSGQTLEADLALFATGRSPNTSGLGLAAAGVTLAADGAIPVNAWLQTQVPSIHALGDVTNRINLTPVATAEGMALARTLFRDQPTSMDYSNIPTAVFSHPNVATVGLSEQAARAQFAQVDIYKTGFRSLKHTLTENTARIFMKLVVDAQTDRVLGAHMIGPDAGETIQGIAIALKCGATKAQFDATIGIHPSAAEEFVTMREKSA